MSVERIGEIDFFRAVAIVLMVIYHFVYDLHEFLGLSINYQAPLWATIGKTSALLFIFLSGVSSGFSKNPVIRGMKILGYGMLITFVTYVFFPHEYVRFGIMHFLGTAMLIYPLIRNLENWIILLLSLGSMIVGVILQNFYSTTAWFIPLGLIYMGFTSMDYYPLFPYLGISFLGVLFFRNFYMKGKRLLLFKRSKIAETLSRNSLGIYMVHQPILVAVIMLFKKY